MAANNPPPHGHAAPSMQDVAQAAGVSLGTVSNVMNHPDKVSPATAKRVRDAIDRLGFVRNDAARSLASGSNNSVGMVLADIENSLFIDMAHGAQDAARAAGLNLLLANTGCDMRLQEDYLDLFDQARVTGVLLAPMEDSSAGIARVRSHGRPVVLLNYAPRPATCCSVLVNNERVGYLAARHLIETGCRRLAYIAAHDDLQPVRDRRRGVHAAVEEAGSEVSLEDIDSLGLTATHGHQTGRALARRAAGQLPDGLVVVADELANGIIHELHTVAGIRVPEQVSIIGCENNRTAGWAAVPLTAVDMPGRTMGQEAMRLLIEEVTAGAGHRHATVVLEPELVLRASALLAPRNGPSSSSTAAVTARNPRS